MQTKSITMRFTGLTPLLVHRGELAYVMDKFSKAMKKITNKRKKTDADHIELGRLEFLGSLYMGEKGPIMPAENIRACMYESGKKERRGPDVKSGVFVQEHSIIEYEGPKTPDGLWKNEAFRNVAGVRIGKSRVFRTRPMFQDWSLVTTIEYLVELFDQDDIIGIAQRAGTIIGIGDWRPKYGRFKVEAVD